MNIDKILPKIFTLTHSTLTHLCHVTFQCPPLSLYSRLLLVKKVWIRGCYHVKFFSSGKKNISHILLFGKVISRHDLSAYRLHRKYRRIKKYPNYVIEVCKFRNKTCSGSYSKVCYLNLKKL